MMPQAVARAFLWACETELQALKPGNVHVHAASPQLTVAQFRRSARAAAPHVAREASRVGRRILGAIAATQAAVGTNTNLGIVLLAAPLCHAALTARGGTLESALEQTLAGLDIGDARLAYQAIARAQPAGLGRRPAQDVRAPPTVTLRAAMRLAAGRDRVARQYAATYADVLRIGVPALEKARAEGLSAPQAAGRLYMTFLRRFSDSHLARKFGPGVAAAVRREARAVPDTRAALLRFDRALKRRGLNPGTTADLVVASLLAWRLVPIVGGEDNASTGETMAKAKTPAKTARITKLMVGEALVGDGNEVAHIDLILGPRGSAAETAFCNALINQRQGINGLLAVVTPNLLAKPNTVMFNKVFIKGAKQAVQMFGPAQHAVATAVMDCVADGTIPAAQADDLFIAVGVFIHWDAQDDKKIHDYNYEATKLSIKRAVAGEPKAADVVAQYKKVKHPFYGG